MFSQLPPDIYTEIYQHLPPKSRSAFRRINTRASQIPLSAEECCSEPSLYEIATWLEQQSFFLANIHSRRKSVLNQLGKPGQAKFGFGNGYRELVYVVLDLNTGKLTGETNEPHYRKKSTLFEDRDDILNYIYGYKPSYRLDRNFNWPMLRDIFSRRHSCNTYSSDSCFIKFLIKYFQNYDRTYESYSPFFTLILLKNLLNYSAGKRLERDFLTDANIKELNIPIDRKHLHELDNKYQWTDKQLLKQWFLAWISTLTPSDLTINDPRIAYANTLYQ